MIPAALLLAAACHVGSYQMANGTVVDIAPDGRDTLRWTLFDGETGDLHKTPHGQWVSTIGWTDRRDNKVVAFPDCTNAGITFDGVTGRRLSFDVQNATFESHG